MLATDNNLVPSQLEGSGREGSGTFCMATRNIVDKKGGGLRWAAAGLVQMGIGLAVLTKTKNFNSRHPKTASRYTIMCSEATSGLQGMLRYCGWKMTQHTR